MSLDASELRLGNWLQLKGHPTIQSTVSFISNAGTKQGFACLEGNGITTPCERLEGIPLTEEWLIKTGFDKIRDGNMSPDIYARYYTRVLVTSVIELGYDGLDCRWMEGNTNVPLSFVHELQNLYFALTREEITIKL